MPVLCNAGDMFPFVVSDRPPACLFVFSFLRLSLTFMVRCHHVMSLLVTLVRRTWLVTGPCLRTCLAASARICPPSNTPSFHARPSYSATLARTDCAQILAAGRSGQLQPAKPSTHWPATVHVGPCWRPGVALLGSWRTQFQPQRVRRRWWLGQFPPPWHRGAAFRPLSVLDIPCTPMAAR